MNLSEARALIAPAVSQGDMTWADIGAGTGLFTLAICQLIGSGTVYAVDKSPHALWSLQVPEGTKVVVIEGDFNRSMDLPAVDGLLMANALHYAKNPDPVLRNVLSHLRPGGLFILIEYETTSANQWVPYPITFESFSSIAVNVGLTTPSLLATHPSSYGHDHIYAAVAHFGGDI